jgi:hypothetical protein
MNSPSGPAIKIYANNWVATVLTSLHPNVDGFFNVYCTTEGTSWLDAVNAAIHVLNVFAHGREAWIRVEPEASSDTDCDTKIIHHRGIVRFAYKLQPGSWHYAEKETHKLFGEQH